MGEPRKVGYVIYIYALSLFRLSVHMRSPDSSSGEQHPEVHLVSSPSCLLYNHFLLISTAQNDGYRGGQEHRRSGGAYRYVLVPLATTCRLHGLDLPTDIWIAASRQEMSDARLPLAYRDSCANLLIPLNRCRRQEYYLPWKCEVWSPSSTCHSRSESGSMANLIRLIGGETQL